MRVIQAKRHGLTQIGNETPRTVSYRRDADCPVKTFTYRAKDDTYLPAPGRLININEDECLVLGDLFPKYSREIFLLFPGIAAKVPGLVRKQGDHTILVQFANPLPALLVDKIANINRVPAD